MLLPIWHLLSSLANYENNFLNLNELLFLFITGLLLFHGSGQRCCMPHPKNDLGGSLTGSTMRSKPLTHQRSTSTSFVNVPTRFKSFNCTPLRNKQMLWNAPTFINKCLFLVVQCNWYEILLIPD